MKVLQSQYIRYETAAGGSACSNIQLIKQAHKAFSYKGKLLINKPKRKAFYKSLIIMHDKACNI